VIRAGEALLANAEPVRGAARTTESDRGAARTTSKDDDAADEG
jgi:hypothetical protein